MHCTNTVCISTVYLLQTSAMFQTRSSPNIPITFAQKVVLGFGAVVKLDHGGFISCETDLVI